MGLTVGVLIAGTLIALSQICCLLAGVEVLKSWSTQTDLHAASDWFESISKNMAVSNFMLSPLKHLRGYVIFGI